MKRLVTLLVVICLSGKGFSQKHCETYKNFQSEMNSNPEFKKSYAAIEEFTKKVSQQPLNNIQSRLTTSVIKIPVVVHVLYHFSSEKISDDIVREQIKILNRDFRRKNADTSLTPLAFRNVAADCEIEFQLATSDPMRYSANGIIKKYTPITQWEANDKMKYDSEMGSDAWDTKSYLNIWVCHLGDIAGYATVPGSNEKQDGVVIDFNAFGVTIAEGYGMGRTAVHEMGHWLNLKHIWGDSDCGDDAVSDTPKQQTYSVECPSGIRISCNNGPTGNMYMNYMDLTDDECMNLFTIGQKERMRALFASGGARESLLDSKGLLPPLVIVQAAEMPDPVWLFTKIYPNPATDKLRINVAYDSRWLGKIIAVNNMNGQTVMYISINSPAMEVDISKLIPGVYFLSAKKEDGEIIRHKLIKM